MYQKTVLDNGLRVLTASMPHARSVSVVLLVGTGSRYERPEEAGVSHLLEHMCFKGTQRRPQARDISETIEQVGGVLNASTDREVTTYWCKVAHPHLATALDLLADMTRNSLFQPEELEKERRVVLEELALNNDFPTSRVDALIDELLWPDQPLGRDVGGTKESVQRLTREALLGYLQRQYVPANTVVAVAGGISHQQVVETVAHHLGNWHGDEPTPWFPAQDGQSTPRMRVERRPTEQAHLCVGLKGLPATHPDRYALDLLNVILGEGMSSRLFLTVREQQGLAYDIHSAVNHLLDTGSLVVYAGVDPKKADRAVAAILRELARLKERIPPGEVTKAKELTKGRLLLRTEDNRWVAGLMGAQELLLGQILTVEEIILRVEAITTEDLQRVACQVLVDDKLNLAVVGPFRSEQRFHRLLHLDRRPS